MFSVTKFWNKYHFVSVKNLLLYKWFQGKLKKKTFPSTSAWFSWPLTKPREWLNYFLGSKHEGKEWQWRNKEKSNHCFLQESRNDSKRCVFPWNKTVLPCQLTFRFCRSHLLHKYFCFCLSSDPYLHRRAHLILWRCCCTTSVQQLDLAKAVDSTL